MEHNGAQFLGKMGNVKIVLWAVEITTVVLKPP
jgi:hypothetical protein